MGNQNYAERIGMSTSVTVIRGVQYIVCSFFDGDKPIYDKIGDLIKSSFETSTAADLFPNHPSANTNTPEKQERTGCPTIGADDSVDIVDLDETDDHGQASMGMRMI